MDKLTRSAVGGGLGFLGGVLVEHGIHAVFGTDFINGVCEVAGTILGLSMVNRDLIEAAYNAIRRETGKEPASISKDEWERFKKENPNTARYLEKALAI